MTVLFMLQPKNDAVTGQVSKTTMITGVVAKNVTKETEAVKGERMENDADHMEVRASQMLRPEYVPFVKT